MIEGYHLWGDSMEVSPVLAPSEQEYLIPEVLFHSLHYLHHKSLILLPFAHLAFTVGL